MKVLLEAQKGGFKDSVLSDWLLAALAKKLRTISDLICPTSAARVASGDRHWPRNSQKPRTTGGPLTTPLPSPPPISQREGGCQDVGKAGIKGGGGMSGVRTGMEVRGMGRDQKELEICQSPRWVRYSRG